MTVNNEGMERPLKLPRDCRLTLIPILLILVIPFYVFIPTIQQKNFLRLLNETVVALTNVTRHGAQNHSDSK